MRSAHIATTIISLIALSGYCFAAEAPAEESAGFVVSNLEVIISAIVTILTAFGVWTKIETRIQRKLGENKFKIWEISKGVVADVYHDYVKEIKKSREDGKLTVGEAKEARNKAISLLKEKAKEGGIDAIKIMGEAAFPALIEKAVNYLKKDAIQSNRKNLWPPDKK